MKKKIIRLSVLVVLGMLVMAVVLPNSSTAIGGLNSGDSLYIAIDSDNDSENETFTIWHDGSPHSDSTGEVLFRIQEDGNIGIGTANPQYKLDVAGTVNMTRFKMLTGASEGYVLTSDASGVGTWQPAPGGIAGSGTINFIPKFTDSTSLGNSVICENNSNIGIGTTSPSGKLEVIGDIVVSGTVDGVDIDVAVANLIATDLALQANIDSEEAARIAADIALQSNIDAETAARVAADVALQADIDAEEAARIAADIALQNNIDAEEAARIAADIALQNNIDAEEAARIAADIVLQNNIDAEEGARISADIALQNNIDAEEAARITADNTLQTNIDNLAAIDALDYDSLQDLESAVANGFNIATVSGNVGIGTLIPTEKLDINGGLRIRNLPQDDTIDNIMVADANGVLHTRDVNTIGFQTNIITITDDYTPDSSDYTILVDASSNNVNVELPPAADALSQVIVLKRIDDDNKNTVIIDGFDSEKIDSDLTVELNCQYMSYTIQNDGSNWYILTSYGFMGKSHINNENR